MSHGIGDIGLHIAQLVATVVGQTSHMECIDSLLFDQHGDSIGQLDLITGTGGRFFEQRPDMVAQYIAADHGQIAWCLINVRFFNQPGNGSGLTWLQLDLVA